MTIEEKEPGLKFSHEKEKFKTLEELLPKYGFNHLVNGFNWHERFKNKNLEVVVKEIREGKFKNKDGFFASYGKETWDLEYKHLKNPIIIFNEKLTKIVASKKYYDGNNPPKFDERDSFFNPSYGSPGGHERYRQLKESIEVAYHQKNPENYQYDLALGTLVKGVRKTPHIAEIVDEDKEIMKYISLLPPPKDKIPWALLQNIKEYGQLPDDGKHIYITNWTKKKEIIISVPIKIITPDIVKMVAQKKDGGYEVYRF